MKTTTALILGVLLSTLGGTGLAASMQEFEQAYAAAEVARKQANSVGGEWRDVGKLLEEARAAAGSGDIATAMKLADKAKTQSELGYRQAVEQQGKDLTPSVLR